MDPAPDRLEAEALLGAAGLAEVPSAVAAASAKGALAAVPLEGAVAAASAEDVPVEAPLEEAGAVVLAEGAERNKKGPPAQRAGGPLPVGFNRVPVRLRLGRRRRCRR